MPEVQRSERERALAWLCVLSARASIFVHEINYIGTNLKIGVVTPEEALDWIDELDPVLRQLVEASR